MGLLCPKHSRGEGVARGGGVRDQGLRTPCSRTPGKKVVALGGSAKSGKWTLNGLEDIVACQVFQLFPKRKKKKKAAQETFEGLRRVQSSYFQKPF